MTDQERGLRKEYLNLIALYEQEQKAQELLDRLSAIGVDTSEATTLRVEIDEQQRSAGPVSRSGVPPLPITARGAITGALVGSALALVTGLALYSTGLSSLPPFLDGLFNYAVASVAAGAVVGAFLGSIFGTAKQRRAAHDQLASVGQLKSAGFLVSVKMTPRLAEQAEEIARSLGAKEIIF